MEPLGFADCLLTENGKSGSVRDSASKGIRQGVAEGETQRPPGLFTVP